MEEQEKEPMSKQLFKFYFVNSWYSLFTITYLLFFFYSAIFYFDRVLLALKFLYYTIRLSTALLSLSHLFLGIGFMVALIIPFSVSISAIFIFFNLWKESEIQIKQKLVSTLFIIIIIITIMISMDDIIRVIAQKEPLADFVQKNELSQKIMSGSIEVENEALILEE